MIDQIFFALWFFLPAGIANASPVFANKIPLVNKWKTPMDFGKTYNGKRIFGTNKTWRGLVFGALMGAIVGLIIEAVYPESAATLRITPLAPGFGMALLGALLGIGALLGDAIESFFKRQNNVPAGKSWFPFDQIDYIIGALVASTVIVPLSFSSYLTILVVWFFLHVVSAYIGYRLGLKDTPI